MQVFSDMASSAIVTDNTSTITLADGSKFPQATRGTNADSASVTWFKVVLRHANAFEICHVRTHTGNGVLANLLRGQEGTAQQTWPANDTLCTLSALASDLSTISQKPSEAPADGKQYARKDAAWVEVAAGGTSIAPLAYDSRASLRSTTPTVGDLALIDGLGLYQWTAGSTEPDDDESCFATASGRWLLMCPHWDVVNDWQLPDDSMQDDKVEDLETNLPFRLLKGTATCSISTVAATVSATFTGTVTGAAVGDRVLVTPPAPLGNSPVSTARLSYHAWVSAENTVTVALCNASAAATSVNPAVKTAWPILVFKEI